MKHIIYLDDYLDKAASLAIKPTTASKPTATPASAPGKALKSTIKIKGTGVKPQAGGGVGRPGLVKKKVTINGPRGSFQAYRWVRAVPEEEGEKRQPKEEVKEQPAKYEGEAPKEKKEALWPGGEKQQPRVIKEGTEGAITGTKNIEGLGEVRMVGKEIYSMDRPAGYHPPDAKKVAKEAFSKVVDGKEKWFDPWGVEYSEGDKPGTKTLGDVTPINIAGIKLREKTKVGDTVDWRGEKVKVTAVGRDGITIRGAKTRAFEGTEVQGIENHLTWGELAEPPKAGEVSPQHFAAAGEGARTFGEEVPKPTTAQFLAQEGTKVSPTTGKITSKTDFDQVAEDTASGIATAMSNALGQEAKLEDIEGLKNEIANKIKAGVPLPKIRKEIEDGLKAQFGIKPKGIEGGIGGEEEEEESQPAIFEGGKMVSEPKGAAKKYQTEEKFKGGESSVAEDPRGVIVSADKAVEEAKDALEKEPEAEAEGEKEEPKVEAAAEGHPTPEEKAKLAKLMDNLDTLDRKAGRKPPERDEKLSYDEQLKAASDRIDAFQKEYDIKTGKAEAPKAEAPKAETSKPYEERLREEEAQYKKPGEAYKGKKGELQDLTDMGFQMNTIARLGKDKDWTNAEMTLAAKDIKASGRDPTKVLVREFAEQVEKNRAGKGKPEVKAEAPKAEAPKAEAPKAEAPKAEAPTRPAKPGGKEPEHKKVGSTVKWFDDETGKTLQGTVAVSDEKGVRVKTTSGKEYELTHEDVSAEAPKPEAPKAEEPKAETKVKEGEVGYKAEAPKAEAPKAEEPKAETPKKREWWEGTFKEKPHFEMPVTFKLIKDKVESLVNYIKGVAHGKGTDDHRKQVGEALAHVKHSMGRYEFTDEQKKYMATRLAEIKKEIVARKLHGFHKYAAQALTNQPYGKSSKERAARVKAGKPPLVKVEKKAKRGTEVEPAELERKLKKLGYKPDEIKNMPKETSKTIYWDDIPAETKEGGEKDLLDELKATLEKQETKKSLSRLNGILTKSAYRCPYDGKSAIQLKRYYSAPYWIREFKCSSGHIFQVQG